MFDYNDIKANKELVESTWNSTKHQITEMSQIKSDFDWQHFTVGKEGPGNSFLACKFHFLMRQERFALQEAQRYYIELEENSRKIKAIEDGTLKLKEDQWKDIEIRKLQLRHDELEIEIANQLHKIDCAEILRKKLIELNDGIEYTNKQYQLEQTEYYQWFIANEFVQGIIQAKTGISVGVIEAHRMATNPSILPDGIKEIMPILDLSNGMISLDKIKQLVSPNS